MIPYVWDLTFFLIPFRTNVSSPLLNSLHLSLRWENFSNFQVPWSPVIYTPGNKTANIFKYKKNQQTRSEDVWRQDLVLPLTTSMTFGEPFSPLDPPFPHIKMGLLGQVLSRLWYSESMHLMSPSIHCYRPLSKTMRLWLINLRTECNWEGIL